MPLPHSKHDNKFKKTGQLQTEIPVDFPKLREIPLDLPMCRKYHGICQSSYSEIYVRRDGVFLYKYATSEHVHQHLV